jgi:hypothetical protein
MFSKVRASKRNKLVHLFDMAAPALNAKNPALSRTRAKISLACPQSSKFTMFSILVSIASYTLKIYLKISNSATKKGGGGLPRSDKHKTRQNKRRSLPLILVWLMTRGSSARSWTNRKKEGTDPGRSCSIHPQKSGTELEVYIMKRFDIFVEFCRMKLS